MNRSFRILFVLQNITLQSYSALFAVFTEKGLVLIYWACLSQIWWNSHTQVWVSHIHTETSLTLGLLVTTWAIQCFSVSQEFQDCVALPLHKHRRADTLTYNIAMSNFFMRLIIDLSGLELKV